MTELAMSAARALRAIDEPRELRLEHRRVCSPARDRGNTLRGMHWTWALGALCAFVLALITTPAGVSGAVLLLPVQVSVLGVPSPAVTPTNLLFNVLSTPGALWRFRKQNRLFGPLTRRLAAGTLPGVVAGGVIRVTWLSGSASFMYVASAVLLPLGLWLLLGSQRIPRQQPASTHGPAIWVLALVVGVVGGIYGIGGGSLLAPILIALGYSVYEVAPATIAATFITSLTGVGTYQLLQLSHGGAIAPEWILGAFLGIGGLAGSYCGARLQEHLPERALRRLLGLVACVIAARYLQTASTRSDQARSGAQIGRGPDYGRLAPVRP